MPSFAVNLQDCKSSRHGEDFNLEISTSEISLIREEQFSSLPYWPSGILSGAAESQLSKRTWVTKTGMGDLKVQGGHLCRIPSLLSKSSAPYTKVHNSGQLHKKTFFYFPLILGLTVLLVNAFGKTFHQGQLLWRHFCLRGSSCRQTNSFPKLLFWQLAKEDLA